MPLVCLQERRSPSHTDDDDNGEDDVSVELEFSAWQALPDSILLHIFSFLDIPTLAAVAVVCKSWCRVSYDETLWRAKLHLELGSSSQPLRPGKTSWKEEVKRVKYHAPLVWTETLTEHNDEVLHVTFSHDGKMFSTTSKDASLKVWEMGYPTSLKYSRNFAEQLGWDFTQFSAFNESDTLVLVSSVKTVSIMDRRGYMAVLSLIDDFAILQVVTMDPSQLFGAWMDDSTFLGGSLQISLDRFATTVQIEAHKVKDTRGSGSEWEGTPDDSSGIPLFNFSSETASLIKFLTVSTVVPSLNQSEGADIETTHESEPMVYDTDSSPLICLTQKEVEDTDGDSMSRKNTSMYSSYKKQCHHLKQASASLDRENVNLKCKHDKEQLHCDLCKKHDADSNMDIEQEGLDKNVSSGAGLSDCRKHKVKYCSICDNASKEKLKNLIYVTGEFAVALHQLGFKNISPLHGGGSSSSSQPFGEDGELGEDRAGYDMVVNYSNNDVHWLEQPHPADTPDHLIDLHGHVTGLCLSADHRYLYINCRPWVGTVDLADPWLTPELSPNIEVRIIDLVSLLDLGVFYRGHQGFSPSNMCCFVFLDVSEDFVSSGSEDALGYVWDRHYHSLLGTLPHTDGVVNATAFSPINQEYLVTASDDHTLKVWRSRAEVRRLGIQVPEEIHRRDNTELDKVTNKSPENRNIPLEVNVVPTPVP